MKITLKDVGRLVVLESGRLGEVSTFMTEPCVVRGIIRLASAVSGFLDEAKLGGVKHTKTVDIRGRETVCILWKVEGLTVFLMSGEKVSYRDVTIHHPETMVFNTEQEEKTPDFRYGNNPCSEISLDLDPELGEVIDPAGVDCSGFKHGTQIYIKPQQALDQAEVELTMDPPTHEPEPIPRHLDASIPDEHLDFDEFTERVRHRGSTKWGIKREVQVGKFLKDKLTGMMTYTPDPIEAFNARIHEKSDKFYVSCSYPDIICDWSEPIITVPPGTKVDWVACSPTRDQQDFADFISEAQRQRREDQEKMCWDPTTIKGDK